MFTIRDAVVEDAAAICAVIKRSVTTLCVGDHQNDPDVLARWAGTKTPELIAGWINNPDTSMVVAVEDGKVLGVASITGERQIALNYILPEARFRGISRAMIRALEGWAAQKGIVRLTADSTGTARQFYLSMGYAPQGEAKTGLFGTVVYPMGKGLGFSSEES